MQSVYLRNRMKMSVIVQTSFTCMLIFVLVCTMEKHKQHCSHLFFLYTSKIKRRANGAFFWSLLLITLMYVCVLVSMYTFMCVGCILASLWYFSFVYLNLYLYLYPYQLLSLSFCFYIFLYMHTLFCTRDTVISKD